MEKSDRIYVGGDYLGKVVAQKMKDNADISIIEIPSRSNFVPSCFTNTGDFVGYYSLPVVGHSVRIFSKDKRKNIYGRITEFRADIFWDDKKYNDKNWYFDMVGFQVISDNVMEGGDSGSAVAKVYEDDEYALCSIYKGQKEYDYGNRKELWGYATRWDTVEKEFDVSLCEGE